MRTATRVFTALAGGLLLTAPAAPALAQGPPTVTHFEIVSPEPIVDDMLSPACGFTVYVAIHLTGVDLLFENGQPSGLAFQSAFRNDVTFSANGKTLTFVERGHQQVRWQPDGTVTVTVAGRNFGEAIIGRKVTNFDPQTGEVLSVTRVGRSLNLADFCSALAP
jgi:hypothetical protein